MFMASHLILLLLLLFFGSITSADVSIDCGSSDVIYSDDNSIPWSGDTDFISNGDSRVVQTGNSISHVMDTLRVFTSRKKNCYTVPADQGGRVYARASFYYGNYDQKSAPPSFDLHFDGNYWATVQTQTSSVVYYEVVYVVKGDSTSICVAQTKPGQFPFMSALEIRSLDSTMYNHVDDNRALLLSRRVAYGTNQTIRFTDDLYDRIWTPSPGGNGLIAVTNTDSPVIITSVSDTDNPPEAVLLNGVTTSDVSVSIRLGTVFPVVEVPVYMNLYFSEVTQLDSTQNRSFTLFKDNTSISDSIVPPFGEFIEVFVTNGTVNSATEFYLAADSASTLPPLINAMEVFLISDPLTNGTNSNDVEGLASLQNTFDALQEWSGDPCLPAPYSWDWVNCSNDATPRITALYLSSFGLSGLFPDISSMSSLQTIDLHNNSLEGPIPDSLGSLSNLKQLNLADNQFSGSIPASLSKKNNLDLVVTGNPDLCTSGKSCQSTVPATSGSSGNPATAAGSSGSNKKSSSKLPVILGTTIPIFVLIWAVAAVFAVLHYRRKSAAVTAANAGGQNGGTANGNNNGINAEAVGKVGLALFKAYIKNENNSSDNATTSNNNNNETA